MKKSVFELFVSVAVPVAYGHRAIDCFKEENLLGGAQQYEDDPVDRSDQDLVLSLDAEHELTTIKVCTDVAVTYIRGLQVSYGKFSGTGEIFEAVRLNEFGDLDQASSVCTNFYIPQNDYLTNVYYRYNLLGISQL